MSSTATRPARPAGPGSSGAPTRPAKDPDGFLARALPFLGRLESPVTSYYVLLGTTMVLVVIGLVMVLSASMVTSIKDDGSSFGIFRNQLLFAGAGLVGAVLAARIPVPWCRRLAIPALGGAIFLQLLVFTPLGVSVNGNRNWVRLVPGVQIQPSELTKIGLILVGALVLANKRKLLGSFRHVVFPFLLPVAAGTVGLVLLGHNLGTALVLLAIVGALLFVAGVPARFFLLASAAASALALVLVVTSQNRMGRIASWLTGTGCDDPSGGACYQSVHGLYAASGPQRLHLRDHR